MDLSAPLSIAPTLTVDQTLEIMDKEGYDQLPVIDETGYVWWTKEWSIDPFSCPTVLKTDE